MQTWCPVPVIDRSLSKSEYMHWRRETRRIGRYGMRPWHIDWPVYADRAVNQAEGERIARQMAIEIRVRRNKLRMGIA